MGLLIGGFEPQLEGLYSVARVFDKVSDVKGDIYPLAGLYLSGTLIEEGLFCLSAAVESEHKGNGGNVSGCLCHKAEGNVFGIGDNEAVVCSYVYSHKFVRDRLIKFCVEQGGLGILAAAKLNNSSVLRYIKAVCIS